MTRQLKYGLELEKKMRPKKNKENKNTERFKKKKTIPQYIGLWVHKLPFKENADGKIDSIPQADEKVGPSPNFRYAFN